MAKLANVDFDVLDASGKNYLSWRVDLKFHLRAMALLHSILAPAAAQPTTPSATADPTGRSPEVSIPAGGSSTPVSDMDKAKAAIYIRRHLHRTLKADYFTVVDPLELWTELEARFRHHIYVILPRASNDWEKLRLLDYMSVAEYNSALHNITSSLKLCGDEVSELRMLEKTIASFHERYAILMPRYLEDHLTRFSDLLSRLPMAEQNGDILQSTPSLRPAGAAPIPEPNLADISNSSEFAPMDFENVYLLD